MPYEWLDNLVWWDLPATRMRRRGIFADPAAFLSRESPPPVSVVGSLQEPICLVRILPYAQADLTRVRLMARAKRVVELLAAPNGPGISEIAKAEGVRVSDLKKDPDIRALAERTIERYSLPPEKVREFVKALRLKIAAQAADAGDYETALKATGQIASDPEYKLTGAFANLVVEGDKTLNIVFPKELDEAPIDVPALPAGEEKHEDR